MSSDAYALWPEAGLDDVHAAVVHLLNEVGVRVDSGVARDLLVSVGARELGGGRLGLPWPVVEQALHALPDSFTLVARDADKDVRVTADGGRTWVHCFGEAPFASDARTGAVRRATVRDQILAARVAHHLQYPEILNPIFSPSEVSGDLQPLISYFLLAAETDKYVGGPGVSRVAQVHAIHTLASLVVTSGSAARRYPVQMSFSPVSPLALGRDVADALMEAGRLGVVCELLPCPVAGTTAPASLSGALAQETAEALACCVLVQAVAPGTPCIYGARLVACDPRSGAFVAGGPELGYCAVGAAALGRRYGLPTDCYGLATDSKVVDVQWALERTMNAFLGAMGKPAFLSGPGLTQSGLAACVDVLPLDDEILARIAWALRPARTNEQQLDPTYIASGVTSDTGFLGVRETRRHMHSEFFATRLAFRGTLEQWLAGGDRDLFDASTARAAELAGRDPIGLPDDTAAEMAKVIAQAAPELAVTDPPDVRRLRDDALRDSG
jgi:trimethylamine--corrinoid protein Co-methyltransferase